MFEAEQPVRGEAVQVHVRGGPSAGAPRLGERVEASELASARVTLAVTGFISRGAIGPVSETAAVDDGAQRSGLAAIAPFDQEDGGVVVGEAAAFSFQGVGEGACHRPYHLVLAADSGDGVDQLG